jgi:hypothetical protein
VSLSLNGAPVEPSQAGGTFRARHTLPSNQRRHSEWSGPYGHLVTALAADGRAAYVETGTASPSGPAR